MKGHENVFASAKGKQQEQVRQLQSSGILHCIDHIPYYLSGLSRAHFFQQPFSKQLYTNWFVSIRANNYFLLQELNTQSSTKKFNNVITYQQQQQQQQFIQFLNNLPQLAELFYKVSKKNVSKVKRESKNEMK